MNPVGGKHTTGAAAFIWLYIKPEHRQTTIKMIVTKYITFLVSSYLIKYGV
jgi:hypothetical protein